MLTLQKAKTLKGLHIAQGSGSNNTSLKLPEDAQAIIGIKAIVGGLVVPSPADASTGTGSNANTGTGSNSNPVYFAGINTLPSSLSEAFVKAFGAISYPAQGDVSLAGFNQSADQYFWYAHPSNKATPRFFTGAFEGGFVEVTTLNLNINAQSIAYKVWRTGHNGLGALPTITVVHAV